MGADYSGSDAVVDADHLDAAYFDPDLDRPHDECGVFGVYAPGAEIARLTYFGLFALQHRGQESAGIAVTDGEVIRCHKDMGLVSQVFDEPDLARLKGHIGIGHTRYSTTGSSILCNAQPIIVDTRFGPIAVAHNGNIVNTRQLRQELENDGIRFQSTNDSEVIAQCIATLHRGDIVRAVRETMAIVEGAYSVVVMTNEQLLAFRDPCGIRPLCLAARNGTGTVVSSETCALNVIGAQFIREIEPGELVVIDRDGISEYPALFPQRPAMCVFEFIYLARPDSYIYGKSLHAARVRMGQELAAEHPADAQVVIPVPDTGFPAAIGFSQASKVPVNEGLIKNRYIGRTFIQPDQRMRELGVRMKLSALKENLAGRRVVMVDDSIVRGTTTGQIVKMIREAGATQVHVRISSPPVKWPCFYGIDMADRKDLIAAKRSVEEIRKHVGADSLGYLSVKGVMRAIGMRAEKFCHACFTGDYPIDVPKETRMSKFGLEGAHESNSGPSPEAKEPSLV
ncbi:MAG TPA: amidophosphoribosyltransferase [Armatimonadota bacterium]|nr:amidophosphoribosyltransferase [Armatimonadota bacterium]